MPESIVSNAKLCSVARPLIHEWVKCLEKQYESWNGSQFPGDNDALAIQIYKNIPRGGVALFFAEHQSGATALLLKVLQEFRKHALPVLYSSPENNVIQLLNRLMASITGVPLCRLERGLLYHEDFPVVIKAVSEMCEEDSLYFTQKKDLELLKIQQEMRLWRFEEKIRGVMLFDDYISYDRNSAKSLAKKINHLSELAKICMTRIIVTLKVNSINEHYNIDDEDLRLYDEADFIGNYTKIYLVNERDSSKAVFVSVRDKNHRDVPLKMCQNCAIYDYDLW